MKALTVFESLNFERGKDPIDVMDIGIKSWLHNFDTNFFKIRSTEERNIAKEKFNQIMSMIGYEKIPVNTHYFPLTFIFGYRNDKDYRQYKLDYDLYLTIRTQGDIINSDAELTDEKGKGIAGDSDTSAGSQGIKTLLKRIHKNRIKSK